MIPNWNLAGLLPPIWPGEEGHSSNRSPYPSSLAEVVGHFGTSADRLSILRGLLSYRQQLYAFGIVEGFQWLDGSFMEEIEVIDARSPNDIDVVTYFKMPPDETQETLLEKAVHLFDSEQTKPAFSVDAYAMILAEPMEEWHVQQVAYWYSMWSHTRNQNWKGFLRVNLDPADDAVALQLLDGMQIVEQIA